MQFDKADEALVNRVLSKPKFANRLPVDINLSDPVLVYTDGISWKVIPFKYALVYPVVHDIYFDSNYKRKDKYIANEITVCICPYTLTSVILFGTYVPNGYVHNGSIVLEMDSEKVVVPFHGTLVSKVTGEYIESIRRSEIKLMSMRNCITRFPDCKFLQSTIDLEPLVNSDYLDSTKMMYINTPDRTYHPKTFTFVIEYMSQDPDYDKPKRVAVVGEDADKTKRGSYDTRVNKITEYEEAQSENLREKSAIIIPCYWSAAKEMYPDINVFQLQHE